MDLMQILETNFLDDGLDMPLEGPTEMQAEENAWPGPALRHPIERGRCELVQHRSLTGPFLLFPLLIYESKVTIVPLPICFESCVSKVIIPKCSPTVSKPTRTAFYIRFCLGWFVGLSGLKPDHEQG